ncbi:hypothetical protein C8R41DRAFT_609557 [Lentinula lateritia]|uniref:Btz domain-containing protein n=1 Tax=Lentinula lateritia TaxID=40482 RepID=A0ABQ8VTW9_9AGAR|nr:hypothetical protein C8R41DRAFT_609557 [Lentinula lateritia]
MPEDDFENSRYPSRDIRYSPYDSSRRRSHHRSRSRSPSYFLERREAVRTTALSGVNERGVPLQLRETSQLQVTTTKRKRNSDDIGDGSHVDLGSDDDGVYVTMKVTRREQKKILRRRRERDRGHEWRGHSSKKRRTEYIKHDKTGHYDDSCPKRERREYSRTEFSGPNMFSRAEGFAIRGGNLSVVAGDQTILGTSERFPNHCLPNPNQMDHPYGKNRNRTRDDQDDHYSSSPRSKQSQREYSSAAHLMGDIKVSGPNAFTFANNFKIHGGDVSAVGGNQTVMYRQRRADRYANNHQHAHPTPVFREGLPTVIEASSSTSSFTLDHSQDASSYQGDVPISSPSVQTAISGPSLFAYSSGFTLDGSKVYPGSFAAVGGNQIIDILGDDDSVYLGEPASE